MRVLLAKPGHRRHYVLAPNLGLGYLATALRRHGHVPMLYHGGLHRHAEEAFESVLESFRPDVVGLQLFSHEVAAAEPYVRLARAGLPGVRVVAGGPHPSADPEGTMQATNVDYAVCGEAEQALPELLGAVDGGTPSADRLAGVPGLVWKEQGQYRINPMRLPAQLDELGFPAWDLMDPRSYPAAPHGTFARHFPIAPVITSRGCPFSCAFCAAGAISGRRVRARSALDVVEEIALLSSSYGVREIQFEDDNLAHDPDHLASICDELLRRGLRVAWSCPNGVRLERIDRSLARLMERSGCYSMAVGIESGSQRILDAMSKGTTIEGLEQGLRMIADSTRIRLTGFFLTGFPGETAEDIEATVRFALKLPLDKALFAFALPHPGSELHRVYTEMHGTQPAIRDHLYCQSHVPYFCPEGMTVAELLRCHRAAYRRFYMRPRTLLSLLGEMRHRAQLRSMSRRLIPLLLGRTTHA